MDFLSLVHRTTGIPSSRLTSHSSQHHTTPQHTKQHTTSLRKRLGIRIYADDKKSVPDAETEWSKLVGGVDSDVSSQLLENLKALGFESATPIQAQTIPLLRSGTDVLGCAPTGSGKSAAFLIPMILHATSTESRPISAVSALVLTPTNELSNQLYRECKKMADRLPVSVAVMNNQLTETLSDIESLDILISTPGRLISLLRKECIDLSQCSYLICDEGDQLWKLGFLDQVDEILSCCKTESRSMTTALFSATICSHVEELANTVLQYPVRVDVGLRNGASSDVVQELVFAGNERDKVILMKNIFRSGIEPPCLIFVQSKDRAKELYNELKYNEWNMTIGIIHADQSLQHREKTIRNVRTGKIWTLICTEVLARGIDIRSVNCVINYDMPSSAASYVHRIGRTGRAGRKGGRAITFFTEQDRPMLRTVANIAKESGSSIPEWMLDLKKMTKTERLNLKRRPVDRGDINGKKSKKKTRKKRKVKDKNKE